MVRRLVFASAILALWVGNAGASIISCSLNGGGAPPGGCYSSALSFSPDDFLDWGSATAFGEALTSTTSNGQTNPYNAGSIGSPTPWSTQSNGGLGVSVSLGPSAQTHHFSRVDNTYAAWNGSVWDLPNNVSQAQYGSDILTYAGNFGAPPNNPTVGQYEASNVQFGDHLLAMTDSSGLVTGGGEMVLTFNTGITAVGFRIGGTSTDFNALVTAYNGVGGVIGTYSIVDQGDGGTCASLQIQNRFQTPVACDTAPWIGFVGSANQIASISIATSDGSTGASTAFLIDTLQLNTGQPQDPPPVPEPGVMATMGGGVLGLVAFAKARLARLSR